MLLAAVLAPASYVRLTPLPSRAARRPAFPRTGSILLEAPSTTSLYEQYLQTRQAGAYPAKSYEVEPRRPGAATAPAPAPMPTATATAEPALAAAVATAAQWLEWEETGTVPPGYAAPPPMFVPTSQAAPLGAGADWRATAAAPDAGAGQGAGIDWSPGWSRAGGGFRHSVARADPSPNPNPNPDANPGANPGPSQAPCRWSKGHGQRRQGRAVAGAAWSTAPLPPSAAETPGRAAAAPPPPRLLGATSWSKREVRGESARSVRGEYEEGLRSLEESTRRVGGEMEERPRSSGALPRSVGPA